MTVLLDHLASDGRFDVIEVRSVPGGGPPPHRHSYAEWFRVRDGELTLALERDGAVAPARVLRTGETAFLRPDQWHAPLNLSDRICRFEVIAQPARITGYFAEAGVRVARPGDAPDRSPVAGDELRTIGERWGLEFWRGPVISSP